EVTGENGLEAARECVAFDGRDEWLARRLLDDASEAASIDDGALTPCKALEIHAGAEGAARPRVRTHTQVVSSVECLTGFGDLVGHRHRHRISGVRAVHGED